MTGSRYVVVGGGVSAASAIEGIRAHDRDGGILLLTRENHAPYRRSMLTKDVWSAPDALDRLALHDDRYYAENGVQLVMRREVAELDLEDHAIYDDRGQRYGFERLLLATGSRARRLDIPGADSNAVRYFRDLEDYFALETRLERIQHVTVLGGGGTAVEMAAALVRRGMEVTWVFAEEYPLHRLLPREAGLELAEHLRAHGVEIVTGEALVEIEELPDLVRARTQQGNTLSTQLVLVDIGTDPQLDLADAAGLETDEGVVVDEFARTSAADVYAAGDVAEFPYRGIGPLMRIESADHATRHGHCAGENMAGAATPYDWIPSAWLQVFEHRYDAVGDLDPRMLDTHIVRHGERVVLFYVGDDVVRGVVLCDWPERLDWARTLLRAGPVVSAAMLEALVATD